WVRAIPGGTLRIALALTLVVGATVLFWASRDYEVIAPNWDGLVRGIAYEPSHLYNDSERLNVSPSRIDRDMRQLSQITTHIRTYTVDGGMDKVPEIARRYGMTVSLGIWLDSDLDENEKQIELGIKTALANRRTVDRIFVGNEVLERGDLSSDQLNAYIKRVRSALPNRIKVTTAEPWSTWMLSPELGKYVDIISVHLLPYWEGVPVSTSLHSLQGWFNDVQREFPDKPIIIGEVGWPSEGRARRAAEPSLANEAYFDRAFVQFALEKGYDYYLIEAYDQPWKAGEGLVGSYWGLFDADGDPKFPFNGLFRSFPEWRTYTAGAALLTLLFGLLILGRMPRVRQPGYMAMGALVALVTTGLLALLDASSIAYFEPIDIVVLIAMVPLVLLASIIVLTEGIEFVSSMWRMDRRTVRAVIPASAPRVSIHVPCFDEPAPMMIETLNALALLDYENFEVIVLDNNTPDPETWRPVEAQCAALGPRFRFYHMDNVKGFKAGALNEALKLTDPNAEYIAVIDSDYQVEPYWLRRALPFFASPEIALVQGPQDYRDAGDSIFKAICYEEYRGFFHIGMVERNEHNAIIQHGTMTIVRRHALEEVGGWATWCITEDTELGLKLFEAGYGAAYIPESLGKGLIPDTLGAFMTQRYRWAYGAMQIMKRHTGAIFLGRSKLSWAQRYQFLSGWLPWISDALGLVVTIIALVWTALMVAAPVTFDVPMAALSATALALFSAKMIKTLLLYPQKVRSGLIGAIAASTAGLALTHTVAKAVWAGLFTSGKPFLRTPKCADTASIRQVLRLAWQETALLLCCLAALFMTAWTRGFDDPAVMLWMVMLAIQTMPYAATAVTAVLSAMSNTRFKAARAVITAEPAKTKPVLPRAA
ncbi:MAG TPA: glycosyltransferase family 2 protein, partial [Rhizomicrobium sp.]|nr:glycosyltransferase family 2 protein [Rhizomicrobium sp.]